MINNTVSIAKKTKLAYQLIFLDSALSPTIQAIKPITNNKFKSIYKLTMPGLIISSISSAKKLTTKPTDNSPKMILVLITQGLFINFMNSLLLTINLLIIYATN